MGYTWPRRVRIGLCALVVFVAAAGVSWERAGGGSRISSPSGTTLAQFVDAIRGKAKAAENTSGMRAAFASFSAAHGLSAGSIRYSDFVVVRLLFEATRDAGFWNMHWTITNQPPNWDNIWRQWQRIQKPSPLTPTASAECDELSALYAFLAERAGIKGVGLFWPYADPKAALPAGRGLSGRMVTARGGASRAGVAWPPGLRLGRGRGSIAEFRRGHKVRPISSGPCNQRHHRRCGKLLLKPGRRKAHLIGRVR
jgi:hypothetical protein